MCSGYVPGRELYLPAYLAPVQLGFPLSVLKVEGEVPRLPDVQILCVDHKGVSFFKTAASVCLEGSPRGRKGQVPFHTVAGSRHGLGFR